ncbi:MAG: hypothetical protein U1E56_13290 [Bauldia sp.]
MNAIGIVIPILLLAATVGAAAVVRLGGLSAGPTQDSADRFVSPGE